MGKLQDYPYIPASSLTGEDKLLIIRNKSQGLIKLSDLPANIPSDLKTQMNNIFNKKFKTGKSYSPDTWSATVNLMEKLVVKTLTGSTISFLDGADDVPLKSCVVYIPTSSTAISSLTITHTDGQSPASFSRQYTVNLGRSIYGGQVDVVSGTGKDNNNNSFTFTKVAINSRYGSNTLTCSNRNMKVLYHSTGTIPPEQPTLITKTVTSNGIYDADDDNADGYSSVTVNVSSGPEPTIISKTITENGVYNSQDDNADGYSTVEVNIGTPEPVEPDLDSKSITSNGTYLASDDELDGYSSVTVNVPESSFTTKTITSNGTYQASSDEVDGYSSVTVNVSSSTLTTKTITSNGSYSASSDNVDGYSNVVVDVANANLNAKTITENGSYIASDDNLDGYSGVLVDVQTANLDIKTITENGEYLASDDDLDGYSKVVVNVSDPGELPYMPKDPFDGDNATYCNITPYSPRSGWYTDDATGNLYSYLKFKNNATTGHEGVCFSLNSFNLTSGNQYKISFNLTAGAGTSWLSGYQYGLKYSPTQIPSSSSSFDLVADVSFERTTETQSVEMVFTASTENYIAFLLDSLAGNTVSWMIADKIKIEEY